ncbi:MAG: hypothetical protein KDA28_04835, partial [Phycisphaerales bacterium]|nr:hypothetical protein [Phycisphaerales bacterium]
IEDYDTSRRFHGVVRESTPITPPGLGEEVRHIVLEVDQKGIDFDRFETVGVLADGPEEMGSPEYLRLYAIAGFEPVGAAGKPLIELCVRRCFYTDEFNGERYPGWVSNLLCDLEEGESIDLTGPFGNAFSIPQDRSANIVMIGMGTGIAPFRTLVQRMYAQDEGGWQGKVRLFHGARTGLELLYMNEVDKDLGLYMKEETFRAIEALSPRPHFDDEPAIDDALAAHKDEVWDMISAPGAYVYIAGLRQIADQLEDAFVEMAGSDAAWAAKKMELVANHRWRALLY